MYYHYETCFIAFLEKKGSYVAAPCSCKYICLISINIYILFIAGGPRVHRGLHLPFHAHQGCEPDPQRRTFPQTHGWLVLGKTFPQVFLRKSFSNVFLGKTSSKKFFFSHLKFLCKRYRGTEWLENRGN